jgi:hypothetical protein
MAFESYKSSILNDKGDEAINYVDTRTIKYYDKLLELIKTADSLAIEQSSILDKYMILAIRHTVEKEKLLKMTGRELFIHAIKSGMVGKDGVMKGSIGEVTINNDFAEGQFLSDGQPTNMNLHFYKENNTWKIDLTSIFTKSTVGFKKMIDNTGYSENEALFRILENLYGKKPNQDIWKPIN